MVAVTEMSKTGRKGNWERDRAEEESLALDRVRLSCLIDTKYRC